MTLKNFLIVVRDIERSKLFYKELFGMSVVRDFGENVVLTQGLVLQEQTVWEQKVCKTTEYGGHNAELYFETNDLDAFVDKVEKSSLQVKYINGCTERDWGGRMIRIYDPDGHIIEVSEKI